MERFALSWGNAPGSLSRSGGTAVAAEPHRRNGLPRRSSGLRTFGPPAHCVLRRGSLALAALRAKAGGSPRCCPVLCGLRDRCIAAMLATRTRSRSGGTELNHRSQICEVLTGTGSRREKWPAKPKPWRRLDEHQGSAPCIPVWKVLADGQWRVSLKTYARRNGLPTEAGWVGPEVHLR